MYNIVNKDINLPVLSHEGKELKKVKLDSEIFGIEAHMPSVQLAVRVDQSNRRQATAKTKTRAEVSGGGKKPWRQKGTGRARAGSSRSPLWRHGGIVFGPTGEQNYTLKMNKRVHEKALLSVLSDKVASNSLVILENKEFAATSTKEAVKLLQAIGATDQKVLFVLGSFDEKLINSLRNIEKVMIVSTDNLSVYDIINCQKLVITEDALSYLQGDEEEVK